MRTRPRTCAVRCVTEDDLLEYIERRLSPERLADTEAHLRGCDECRQLVVELARSPAEEAERQLIGRYEVLAPIGAGGMGVVYAARDPSLRRTVALKMLRPGTAPGDDEQKMRRRLLREARAMACLSHPNVLPVYDVGELEGQVFLAMELVEGGTLTAWLREKRRSWREVLDVFLDAARGLGAAHAAGLIHRDFKPDNVLVGTDGRVRVTDFGLASAAAPRASQPVPKNGSDPLPSVSATALTGSPAYMAPEQMHGAAVDARADVFSYCVALHEAIYGERPFAGESLAQLEVAIERGELHKPARSNGTPAWLRRAVVRGLQASPAQRFESIEALIAALKRGRTRSRVTLAVGVGAVAAFLAVSWPITAPRIRASLARAGWIAASTRQAEPSELYFRGKVQLRRRTKDDTLAAIQLLEQAVSVDPSLAIAQAELAHAYAQWVAWFAPDDSAALQRAEVAEARALGLNPDLPEAHYAAAQLLWVAVPPRFAHERAIRELQRAIALNPRYAEAHHFLGTVYQHIGLLDQALGEFRMAVDFDPTSQNPTRRIAEVLQSRGEYEEALRIFRQVPPESNSSAWNWQLAWLLQYLGRMDESWSVMDEYLRSHPEDQGGVVTSARAIWHAKKGNRRLAEADIRAAVDAGKGYVHFHHTAYNVGSAYALLSQPGLAVHWLRVAAQTGWPCYPHYANDPNLAKIRTDPGYIDFMRELKVRWERYRARF